VEVPEDWRSRYPRDVVNVGYGLLLGLGVLTNVMTPVFWAFVALAVISGSATAVLLACGLYAITRLIGTRAAIARLRNGISITGEFDESVDLHSSYGLSVARAGSGLLLAAIAVLAALEAADISKTL
jgi:hypothetical protein